MKIKSIFPYVIALIALAIAAWGAWPRITALTHPVVDTVVCGDAILLSPNARGVSELVIVTGDSTIRPVKKGYGIFQGGKKPVWVIQGDYTKIPRDDPRLPVSRCPGSKGVYSYMVDPTTLGLPKLPPSRETLGEDTAQAFAPTPGAWHCEFERQTLELHNVVVCHLIQYIGWSSVMDKKVVVNATDADYADYQVSIVVPTTDVHTGRSGWWIFGHTYTYTTYGENWERLDGPKEKEIVEETRQAVGGFVYRIPVQWDQDGLPPKYGRWEVHR